MKIYKLAFRLHSLSVTFVTPTCSLSLSNYVTMLAANSVSLKDLISGCDCIISSSRLHIISEEISLVVSLILSGWTCSGRFCAITVSTVHLQNLECVENLYSKCAVLLCSWTCGSSFCVVPVTTVQLQTVQFVQYLYSKCAVLLCSWTCGSSFWVVSVTTVQLQTVQFVQYLYSKCAVLLCSWTCGSSFCVVPQ